MQNKHSKNRIKVDATSVQGLCIGNYIDVD